MLAVPPDVPGQKNYLMLNKRFADYVYQVAHIQKKDLIINKPVGAMNHCLIIYNH